MSTWFKTFVQIAFAVAILWFVAAFITFKVRHPWVTAWECVTHAPDALLFRSVNLYTMRPR